MSIVARLTELGIELPEVSAPLASYLPVVVEGNIAYVSGQLPFIDGEVLTGTLGKDISVEQGQAGPGLDPRRLSVQVRRGGHEQDLAGNSGRMRGLGTVVRRRWVTFQLSVDAGWRAGVWAGLLPDSAVSSRSAAGRTSRSAAQAAATEIATSKPNSAVGRNGQNAKVSMHSAVTSELPKHARPQR